MNPIRYASILMLGALTGAAASAEPPPNSIQVTLESYRFMPDPVVLEAGKPVRITFVNAGGRSHDFTAREFFKSARITAGKAPDGRIELLGGERATVDLVPAAGVYKVHCSKFMHSSLGMKGSIVVQ